MTIQLPCREDLPGAKKGDVWVFGPHFILGGDGLLHVRLWPLDSSKADPSAPELIHQLTDKPPSAADYAAFDRAIEDAKQPGGLLDTADNAHPGTRKYYFVV